MMKIELNAKPNKGFPKSIIPYIRILDLKMILLVYYRTYDHLVVRNALCIFGILALSS